MRTTPRALLVAGAALAAIGCSAMAAPSTGSTTAAAAAKAVRKPLSSKVVVIDPGHQRGNFLHTAAIARKVPAGGFTKACNTTGTQTDSGYPESTFAMSVALSMKQQLTAAGATVYLTRSTDRLSDWGLCINQRAAVGNRVHADAVVSIHGDGEPSRLHGFFVMRPAYRKGYTDDIYVSSGRLALALRAGLQSVGLPRANYNGGSGLDTRSDLGTLNLSDHPAVMVELGNMRNATDAAHMRSAGWRKNVYAAGLSRGVSAFLLH
jgi:N-acetylmuramoyl-L-alanine amidase